MKKRRGGKEKIFETRDFWLIAVILIYGFYSGLFKDLINQISRISPIEPISQISPIGQMAYFEIDYGSKRRAFEGEVSSNMSILDALLAASRAGSFDVRYALIGDKAEVMKINGLIEDGLDGRWHFYLNQEEIPAGEIHKIKIKPGDKILAKFE